jgi:hypothetical protein
MRQSEAVFVHLNPLSNVVLQLAVRRIAAVERNGLLNIHFGVEVASLTVEDDCQVEVSFV